ncbi:LacI family DNA-binding transcriptional regulator [Brachybacterium sp. DNPG3]
MSTRKQPTVYDVAREADVSIATVSRVLRQPEKVSAATRARVLEAVSALGYVPNASARGLAGRRTGVLGLLIPGHDIPSDSRRAPAEAGEVVFLDDRDDGSSEQYAARYFEQLLRGAEAAAWRSGFALLVAAGTSVSRDVVLHDLAGRVDGLAVVSRTIPDDLLAQAAARIPLVEVAGRSDDDAPADSIGVDNRGGMSALVRHVLAVKPPGPLLYLEGPPTSPDAAGRDRGFHDAIAGSAEPWDAVLADFTWRGGHRAVRAHLAGASGRPPAAVVGANDQSALGALAALREAGVRVPEDCVVTGFDGIDESRHSSPPLTTVRQPMIDLGIQAVDLLLRRIGEPDAEAVHRRLPVDVLLRASCGPAA